MGVNRPKFVVTDRADRGKMPCVEERITAAQVVIVLEWREQMLAVTEATMDRLSAAGCDAELIHLLLHGACSQLQPLPHAQALDEAA